MSGFLDSVVKPDSASKERLEQIAAIVSEVMSATDPDLKSDLTAKQIIQIARAKAFAGVYHSDLMNAVVTSLLRARYSHKRKSRDELVKALQTTIANEETSETIRRKLLGV